MFAEVFIVSMALSVLKGVSLLVSYINNNAFPQPLKENEESRYLQILSQSKTEPFTLTREVEHARNTLVEHNLRLVAHLVNRFGIQIEYNIKEEERHKAAPSTHTRSDGLPVRLI